MAQNDFVAGEGHNIGGAGYTSARADAIDMVTQYKPRLDEFLAAIAKIAIGNRGDAGAAADKVGLAQDFRKIVDGKRDELVKPFREAAQATNGVVGNFLAPLDAAIADGLAKIETYRKEAAARVAEQKQEQRPPQGAPSDMPAAAQPAAKPIRGDYGKRVVATNRKRAVLEDLSQVPAFIMESRDVRAAIEKVATGMLKQHPEIAGFRIETDETTGVRG